MIFALLLIVAALGVAAQILGIVYTQAQAARCLCRKGAVHPDCPVHGWDAA